MAYSVKMGIAISWFFVALEAFSFGALGFYYLATSSPELFQRMGSLMVLAGTFSIAIITYYWRPLPTGQVDAEFEVGRLALKIDNLRLGLEFLIADLKDWAGEGRINTSRSALHIQRLVALHENLLEDQREPISDLTLNSKSEVLMGYYTSFVTIGVGTVIWGYGDLIACLIVECG